MMLLGLIPLVLIAAYLLAPKGRVHQGWLWAGIGILLLELGGLVLLAVRYGLAPAARYGMGAGFHGRAVFLGHGLPGHWMSGANVFMGGLITLLLLAGIAFLVYQYTRGRAAGKNEPALAQLRLRLAKGEITPEEFEALKAKIIE